MGKILHSVFFSGLQSLEKKEVYLMAWFDILICSIFVLIQVLVLDQFCLSGWNSAGCLCYFVFSCGNSLCS